MRHGIHVTTSGLWSCAAHGTGNHHLSLLKPTIGRDMTVTEVFDAFERAAVVQCENQVRKRTPDTTSKSGDLR